MGPHRHRYLACAMLGLLLPLATAWRGHGIDGAIAGGIGPSVATLRSACLDGRKARPDRLHRAPAALGRHAAATAPGDAGLPAAAKRV